MLAKGLLKVVYLKKCLALDFLNRKPGEYINTISEYQERYQSSRGSIQIALKELQLENVITLKPKGASGTQVLKLDYDKLLAVLNIDTIIGAMPLPYNLRQEGLATAFMQSFKEAPFRFACSYNQGSLNRIKGLINNYYDFIVLSKMASDYYKNVYDLREVVQLTDESYSSKHVWVVRKGITKISSNLRVGIDRSSFDQYFLVREVTEGMNLNFVDIKFHNVVNKILDGTIDAAIWNMDMVEEFKTEEIDIIDNLNNIDEEHAAVVVTQPNRGDIVKIIKDYIKPAIIQSFQKKVQQGVIIPSF